MPAKVQIQIVTYNSSKHLERLFAGIEKQKGVDFEVLVIDNNSQDRTIESLKQYLSVIPSERIREPRNPFNGNHADASFTAKGSLHSPSFASTLRTASVGMTIIENNQNKGFAAGHNQGFGMCEAPYVLILNPDTELQEGFLRNCVDVIESDDRIASVGGVLYQQMPEPPLNPPLNTGGEIYRYGVIDSLGLKMAIYGQISDIGQHTRQKPNFSPKTDVFGITGACALYRLSALKQVQDEHGILDERFGLYSLKDDADLAWRLRNAGFKAKIAPKAIAYHARGTGKGDERRNRSDEVKQTSIRNHLLMLKKNLSWRDWWRMGCIIMYEFAKFVYVLLFETRNLKAYK